MKSKRCMQKIFEKLKDFTVEISILLKGYIVVGGNLMLLLPFPSGQ